MLAPQAKEVKFHGIYGTTVYACEMYIDFSKTLGTLFMSQVFISFSDWPSIEWYLADYCNRGMRLISKETLTVEQWLEANFTYASILL